MGPAVARVAQAMGRPLMPWQRYVADVSGEVDAAGRFVYPLVVCTVQRQSGKTTLDLATSVQRCLQAPNRKVWHTAQTGQDARKKWGELVDDVLASPLRSLVAGRPRRTNGGESLAFVNGSVLRPHPPTRDSLHGEQSDTNNVDEAWVFDEAQGADLFQAIIPTQATRPGAQTFIWSTAGDRSSTWFRQLVNRGRAGEPGLAFFEWSIPDDVDPTDLAGLAAHHPALGHTITLDSLRAAQVTLADKPGEFARAYGNRWTGAGERVLPLEAWNAASTDDPTPEGRPAFGVAVSSDGTMGAVVAAVADDAGQPCLEVLAHRPGRSWLAPYVAGLVARHPGALVALERRGPAGPVADALELDGVELVAGGRPDFPAACQDLFDRVTHTEAGEGGAGGVLEPAPRIRLRSDPAFDDAADVAARRFASDGAWVWSRTRSAGDISALEAGTLAAFAVARQGEPEEAPFVMFR